jgi:hypothetical protein
MVPLHNIVYRDEQRVDLRTSVWITGKLLKILTFVHDAGISIGDLSLGNVLIEPNQHYVVVFDWANARKHAGGVPHAVVWEEIRSVASTVIEVLGGTATDSEEEQGGRYIAHLTNLASNGAWTAKEAHRMFYALADDLWPRQFYPFTTLPLTR